MIRSAARKAMSVGRFASAVFGLALVLALVVGAGTAALAAVPGDPFELGENNAINNALTKLSGSNAGEPMLMVDNDSAAAGSRALELRVEPGKAPLKVSAEAGKSTNLNADEVDGKGADQIGINGLERVIATSVDTNSDSFKTATAECREGKVLVGSGFDVSGGSKTGQFPNNLADVVVTDVVPSEDFLFVAAFEEEPTAANWFVRARAICAAAP